MAIRATEETLRSSFFAIASNCPFNVSLIRMPKC